MKRILFVTASLGYAGAEKMLAFVANSLDKRGHSCAIFNLDSFANLVNQNKQTVNESIPVFTAKKNGSRLDHIKEIYKAAKEFKADVIVGFTSFPGFYSKIVSMLLGIPSIFSERGDPARTTPKIWKTKVTGWFLNHSKGAVFQTEGAMNFYGKGLQKRGIIIPNPIFVKEALPDIPFEEREKAVVSVGRFDNVQKRYDVMVRAFRIFSESHPDYCLKLYGTGADEEKIREWVKEEGVEDRVHFMGLTKTPMADMAKCSIFFITSDYEGISNSLLEAMATGLPCVSTDHTPGGARLLIQDGKNGLLAPMGDEKSLAEALSRFADNEALSKQCGEAAKSVLTRFAPDRIIDLWENYIEKIR